jgi:hypothetical protein
MKQQTLAMAAHHGAGFEPFRKRTKCEDFLDAMQAIVPWAALCAVIEPHYPKAGYGRRPRCRRGMRTLWMPEHHDVLGCRRCVRVRYTSQTQNSNRYHLHAARQVQQQLMVDPGNSALLERLEEHADNHAYISNVQFLAMLSKGPMASLMRSGRIDTPSALARLRA